MDSHLFAQDVFCEAGAVPAILQKIAESEESDKFKEQLIAALWKLSQSNAKCKGEVWTSKGIPILLKIITEPTTDPFLLEQAIGILRNICNKHPENRAALEDANGVEIIFGLMKHSDASLVSEACRTLAVLAEDDDVRASLESKDFFEHIMKLLAMTNPQLKTGAALTLRTLLHLDSKYIKVLSGKKGSLIRKYCWLMFVPSCGYPLRYAKDEQSSSPGSCLRCFV